MLIGAVLGCWQNFDRFRRLCVGWADWLAWLAAWLYLLSLSLRLRSPRTSSRSLRPRSFVYVSP